MTFYHKNCCKLKFWSFSVDIDRITRKFIIKLSHEHYNSHKLSYSVKFHALFDQFKWLKHKKQMHKACFETKFMLSITWPSGYSRIFWWAKCNLEHLQIKLRKKNFQIWYVFGPKFKLKVSTQIKKIIINLYGNRTF